MSHPQQVDFCKSVRARFPALFTNVRALDVGSLDVNGNNRHIFTGGTYLGCDIVKGKNVDHVGPCWTVPGTFQAIVSTEMLEHDCDWKKSLLAMEERLEPSGILVITCAGPGRGKHGFGPKKHGWETMHYLNLSPSDVLSALTIERWAHYAVQYNGEAKDTYFWGIKK